MLNPRIEELARRDPRYAPEAYEFVYEALSYAGRRLGRARAEPPHPNSPPSALPPRVGEGWVRGRRTTNTSPWRSFWTASASWPCASSA